MCGEIDNAIVEKKIGKKYGKRLENGKPSGLK